MATAAEVREALVSLLSSYGPPAGSPAWKRSTEPAAMIRRVKSLASGTWCLDWKGLEPIDRPTRSKTAARASWTVIVPYQLSPAAGNAKVAEEQLVVAWMDALRRHLFIGPGSVVHNPHVWTGETIEAATPDGWVFATISGMTPFYLDME